MSAFNYTKIIGADPTTTLVKSGQGILHSIILNNPTATGVIEIYDGLTAGYPRIASITTPANPQPVTLTYDVAFGTGLTIVTSIAAQDITVTYR